MNKTTLIFLFTCAILTVAAQTRGDGVKATHSEAKIAMADVMGNWYSADSVAKLICFRNINNHYVDIEGIKHGVGNYGFRIMADSISAKGTAPNWPPYDCTLRLIDKKHLEIAFYQFFDTVSTKVTYRR
ncbi:MAG: hypothetical protein IT244_02455 [Bacteroidia bacterium]|nr:hypothetical protein [Bacteroidia bacterium]